MCISWVLFFTESEFIDRQINLSKEQALDIGINNVLVSYFDGTLACGFYCLTRGR
jgi:hypothetical protein